MQFKQLQTRQGHAKFSSSEPDNVFIHWHQKSQEIKSQSSFKSHKACSYTV